MDLPDYPSGDESIRLRVGRWVRAGRFSVRGAGGGASIFSRIRNCRDKFTQCRNLSILLWCDLLIIVVEDKATMGRILRDNGYATSWSGKDHSTPAFAARQFGPIDQWPTGLGFECFYGFFGGDANQWQPILFSDTTQICSFAGKQAWNRITGMADDAIDCISRMPQTGPSKPMASPPGTPGSVGAARKVRRGSDKVPGRPAECLGGRARHCPAPELHCRTHRVRLDSARGRVPVPAQQRLHHRRRHRGARRRCGGHDPYVGRALR